MAVTQPPTREELAAYSRVELASIGEEYSRVVSAAGWTRGALWLRNRAALALASGVLVGVPFAAFDKVHGLLGLVIALLVFAALVGLGTTLGARRLLNQVLDQEQAVARKLAIARKALARVDAERYRRGAA